MDLLELFKQSLFLQKKPASPITVKNYLSDIRHFISWLEEQFKIDFDPKLITGETIELYKNAHLSIFTSSSLERHLSSLRKFFLFLTDQQFIEKNPFTKPVVATVTDSWKIKEFKNLLYRENASAHTIKNYIKDIEGIRNWHAQTLGVDIKEAPNTIDYQLVQEYKTRLLYIAKLSPKTINRKLSAIRRYIEFTQNIIDPQRIAIQNMATKPAILEKEQAVPNILKPNPTTPAKKSSFFNFLNPDFIEDLVAHKIARGIKSLQNKNSSKTNILSNIRKEFYAPDSLSIKSFPLHRKLYHHIRYTRPDWYKKYHNQSFAHYLNASLLIIYSAIIGFMLYQNLFEDKRPSFAAPNQPLKVYSFQGRLTDSSDEPITTSKLVRFIIYTSSTSSSSARLWEEARSISPDSDGIFSVLLGSNSTGGNASLCNGSNPSSTPATGACGIPDNLFRDNSQVFLGISIEQDSELTPRQQIATVAYSTNSQFLQGLPPITQSDAGTTNVVLALDSSGNLTIGGSASPTFQASGGQLTFSGNTLTLKSNSGTNGNIQLIPDGIGKIDLQKPIVNTGIVGNLSQGGVEINDKFGILATESAVAAFVVNNNTTGGDIFTASSSGTTRFTLANDGTTTIAGSVLPSTTGSVNLGSSALKWNNLYVNTINTTSINQSGQAVFTYNPASTAFSESTVLINPTTADANDTLLGIGIAGVEKAGIDAEGDLVLGYSSSTAPLVSNPFNIYNHGTSLVATIDTTGNASFSGTLTLYTSPTIQSTANQTLTLGGNTTGNIVIDSATSSITLSDPTTLSSTLNVSGITTLAGTTIAGTTLINNSGTANTTIGNTAGGTITIGAASGSDLVLNDAQWSVTGAGAATFASISAGSGAVSGGAGSFTTLTSSGATTLGTGSSLTNTFGSGASSVNTIGSVTTPGALTLHGATTLDNTLTVSGSNLTTLGGNLTFAGASPAISASTLNTSISLDANGSGTVNIAGTSTGDVNLAGGSGVTGCTVTNSTGALACSGNITTTATGTPTAGFWTRNTASGYLYPSTLTDNVGIGTTTPTALLDVAGTASVSAQLTIYTTPVIQTTANKSLTIGGNTTGNIVLKSLNTTVFNTPGTANTFVGANAGQANTTGSHNSFFGFESGFSNTTASFNSFIGDSAGYANTTGANNLFVGVQSGSANTTGTLNAFFGNSSGLFNTTGGSNTFIGESSGFSNTTASNNTFIGNQAGYSNTTATGNVFVGYLAGDTATPANANVTGANNTFIGYGSGPGSTTQLTNATAIGYQATVTASNSLVLGSGVNVGIGITAPTTLLSALGTISSAGGAIGTITNNNTTDSANTVTLRLNTGATATTTNARFVTFYAGVTSGDTGGTGVGRIQLNNNNVAYNTGAADFGERFPVAEPTEPGDIIGQIGEVNKKATHANGIIGVVSDTTGFTGNDKEGVDEATNPIVGLLGQVRTKVSTENGPIEVGDHITTSSIPGVGMKATKAGRIVGSALEPYDESGIGKTKVFINPSWYDPDVYITSTGDLNIVSSNEYSVSSNSALLNTKYKIQNTLGQIIDRMGVFAELATASIKTGFLSAQQIVTGSITATSGTIASLAVNSLSVGTNSITIAGQSLQDYITNTVQNILSASTLIPNTSIVSPLASIDQINTNIISPLGSETVAVTGNLEVKNAQNETVARIDTTGSATFSGMLNSKEASISGNLLAQSATISGNLNASNVSISGTLRAGRIIADDIEGLNARIATLAADTVSSMQYAVSSPSASTDFASNILNTPYSILNTDFIDISTFSASFGTFREGLIALGPSTFNQITAMDSISVGTNFTIGTNSINLLGEDLQIQPLKQGGISFLAGLVRIDTQGNLMVGGNADFAKDVTVHGTLAANIISPLPNQDINVSLENDGATSNFKIQGASNSAVLAIDSTGDLISSGSGTFNKLKLSFAQAAYAIDNTTSVATGSAGTAILKSTKKEITINNPLVTENSLIYITPVGNATNQVLYLLRQVAESITTNGSFTVGISAPTLQDIQFNWIIVN